MKERRGNKKMLAHSRDRAREREMEREKEILILNLFMGVVEYIYLLMLL